MRQHAMCQQPAVRNPIDAALTGWSRALEHRATFAHSAGARAGFASYTNPRWLELIERPRSRSSGGPCSSPERPGHGTASAAGSRSWPIQSPSPQTPIALQPGASIDLRSLGHRSAVRQLARLPMRSNTYRRTPLTVVVDEPLKRLGAIVAALQARENFMSDTQIQPTPQVNIPQPTGESTSALNGAATAAVYSTGTLHCSGMDPVRRTNRDLFRVRVPHGRERQLRKTTDDKSRPIEAVAAHLWHAADCLHLCLRAGNQATQGRHRRN